MEAAKLVLEYVDHLIWPVMILSVILWVRKPLRLLFDRLATNADRVDVQFGGQKISVALAERVVDHAVRTALEMNETKGMDPEISAESKMLLEILSQIDREDVVLLRALPASLNMARRYFPNDRIEKILRLDLAQIRSDRLEISALGLRISTLVGASDDPEYALHKIAYAM